ncbi:MAG: hypothetical protein V1750_08575 [Acidobacteriota bacterium]
MKLFTNVGKPTATELARLKLDEAVESRERATAELAHARQKWGEAPSDSRWGAVEKADRQRAQAAARAEHAQARLAVVAAGAARELLDAKRVRLAELVAKLEAPVAAIGQVLDAEEALAAAEAALAATGRQLAALSAEAAALSAELHEPRPPVCAADWRAHLGGRLAARRVERRRAGEVYAVPKPLRKRAK